MKEDRPSKTDWNAIHKRLEEIQCEKSGEEDREEILSRRAKELAREPVVESPADFLEVIEFLLAHEKYALESSFVKEVYPLKTITELPGTPAFVKGIINVRGRIVSVIDIKKIFDLPDKGLGDLNKVIILHSKGMEFGILADVIIGTGKVPLNGLQLSIATLTGVREEYLKGVAQDGLIVLDAEKILRDEKIIVNEKV